MVLFFVFFFFLFWPVLPFFGLFLALFLHTFLLLSISAFFVVVVLVLLLLVFASFYVHTRTFCALYRVVVDVGRKMCVCVCTACCAFPAEGCGLAPPSIIEESNVFVSYGVYDDITYHHSYKVAGNHGGSSY